MFALSTINLLPANVAYEQSLIFPCARKLSPARRRDARREALPHGRQISRARARGSFALLYPRKKISNCSYSKIITFIASWFCIIPVRHVNSAFRKLLSVNEELKQCEWQAVFDVILTAVIHYVFDERNLPPQENEVNRTRCCLCEKVWCRISMRVLETK